MQYPVRIQQKLTTRQERKQKFKSSQAGAGWLALLACFPACCLDVAWLSGRSTDLMSGASECLSLPIVGTGQPARTHTHHCPSYLLNFIVIIPTHTQIGKEACSAMPCHASAAAQYTRPCWPYPRPCPPRVLGLTLTSGLSVSSRIDDTKSECAVSTVGD